MNATLTLQEILKEYGFTKLPRGTTEQQWFEYHDRVLKHEERVESLRPDSDNFNGINGAQEFADAMSAWEMMRSCDAPNQPGYYRANND